MSNKQQHPLPTLQPGGSHAESLIEAAIQGHASTRDAMRWLVRQLVPATQARAQVQGEPFGYIHHFAAHDESGVLIDTTWEADGCADPLPHPTFPSMWKWAHCTPFYSPQPAQATQAEVTDAAIDAATRHIYHNGRPTSKEYRVGIARAILALQKNNFSHERGPMTERELELIDGMIAVQLDHAQRCDAISNRAMAEKQKGWDMERVELLRRIRSFDTTAQAKKEGA